MSLQPVFSIIIPAYNEEKSLPLLLGSIKNQTYTQYEVIVVDGNSTDRTALKAKKFSSSIPLMYLKSPKRQLSYQRNYGARHAHGKWFLFIDADCLLPPVFLEQLSKKLALYKPDIFTCFCLPDTNSVADRLTSDFINCFIFFLKLVNSPGANGAFIGCYSKSFNNHTKFDEYIEVFEDGLFVRRMIKHGQRYALFTQPRFIVSLRRYRAYGHIQTLLVYLVLHLKQKLFHNQLSSKRDYPMGGSIHE